MRTAQIAHQLPARDIGVSVRGVTGIVPGFGKYESSLERDVMELLRFDPNVERFLAQPLTIEFRDRDGKLRSYTPDGLIYFKQSPAIAEVPILFEVKYREDFRKDWRTLMPKFRAAKAYGLTQGWRFAVFTEKEIRTTYLENAKFLWPYREQMPSLETRSLILQTLRDLDEADPELLLCALCHDKTNRARMIPSLWHLISTGVIGCDLTTPLTMHSLIWVEEAC